MEAPFVVYPTLLNTAPVTIINKHYLTTHITPPKIPQLTHLIDTLGHHSATAQHLHAVITTYSKFIGSIGDQTIYIATTPPSTHPPTTPTNTVYGLLKVGTKALYYYTPTGQIVHLPDQLCVLDFYVYEACQRAGIGRLLFDTMLHHTQYRPHQLAYDRPSNKLLAFLAKHYGLTEYVPQRNSYVIYDQYFVDRSRPSTGSRRQRPHKSTKPAQISQPTVSAVRRASQADNQMHMHRPTQPPQLAADALDELVSSQRNAHAKHTSAPPHNINSYHDTHYTHTQPLTDLTNTHTQSYQVADPLTAKQFELDAIQQRIHLLQRGLAQRSRHATPATNGVSHKQAGQYGVTATGRQHQQYTYTSTRLW